jgi:hydrogenase-4 component E
MDLVSLAAAKALTSTAALLFITVLLMAATKRISTIIFLFALQSAILTVQVAIIAYLNNSPEAYAVAIMVLLLKVVGIPYALFRLIERLHSPRGVGASISPAQSVFVAVILIFLAFSAVRTYAADLGGMEEALAAGVALILSGAFLMVSRNKALMQIMGLLVLENGVFLAALATTFGMPLVIEIGISFDLVMGVLLMGIFTFRIRDTFEHLDVSKLRRLRG